MNKAIMLSVNPKWCELIARGEKTIEVRKTRPKLYLPFKVYIYETMGKTETPSFVDEEGHEIYRGRGKVIGEFSCKAIIKLAPISIGSLVTGYIPSPLDAACLTKYELNEYGGGKYLYAWYIDDLVLYDRPKDLSEFQIGCDNKFDAFLCSKCHYCKGEECNRKMKKAPQSWRYVEEVKRDETNL